MKTWKIVLTVTVSDDWIHDGFDMAEREDQLIESVQSYLPYAYQNEIKVTVNTKVTKDTVKEYRT